ncbi:hypothetical protein HHI36_022852 [Cryptolaemus montrouzieri]|uniref:Uncharacterized protein n=1 Tax=Cryptolaemus montrouzieri TaxID=559131 RepID=A0ABD2PF72_9CUCU
MDVEKETLNSELQTIKQRLNNLISEKREVEEEFENQRSKWLIEKSKLQEKSTKNGQNTSDNNHLDKMRFNSLIAEKQSELERFKRKRITVSSNRLHEEGK